MRAAARFAYIGCDRRSAVRASLVDGLVESMAKDAEERIADAWRDAMTHYWSASASLS